MNGATAETWDNTTNVQNKNITTIIGANQKYLRSFMNPQRSFKSSNVRFYREKTDMWLHREKDAHVALE